MTLRDQRQQEFAKKWMDAGEKGILHLCPRFGKIRTSIIIFGNYTKNAKILIAYPDEKIKQSWLDDFEEMSYDNPNVQYTTHLSIKKIVDKVYDIVVIDEIHLLSAAQIDAVALLMQNNPKVLGLSGTLGLFTAGTLRVELGLREVAVYKLNQAIKEGVVVDYEITVIKTPLDNVTPQIFGKKFVTEKKRFNAVSFIINKQEAEGENTMFMRLARMRILQGSLAKKNLTKKIIYKYVNERILVFCGQIKIAESLGIPSYNSKSKTKEAFKKFAEGEGNHMAVVKIGNTGITYKPLNIVIINYFDSNGENLAQKIQRCTAMEYNNADKKAHIYIVSTDERVEEKWLVKALEFFDKKKIKYISHNEI